MTSKKKIINMKIIGILSQIIMLVGIIFSISLGVHNIEIDNLRFRPFIVVDNIIEENKGNLDLLISNKGLIQAENIKIETRIIPKSGDCYDPLFLKGKECTTNIIGHIVFTGDFETPGEVIFEWKDNEISVQPESKEEIVIRELTSTSDPFITDVIGNRMKKNFGVLNPESSINLKILISDIGLEKIKDDDAIFILGINYQYNENSTRRTHYSFFDYNENENIFLTIRQEEI